MADLASMLPTSEVTIGDRTYRLRTLPSEKGMQSLVRLLHLVGGPLGVVAASVTKTPDGKEDISGGAIAAALAQIFTSMTETDLQYFVKLFTDHTEVMTESGDWLPLEKGVIAYARWSGRFSEMFSWLRACVELNYSDFFKGVSAIVRPG